MNLIPENGFLLRRSDHLQHFNYMQNVMTAISSAIMYGVRDDEDDDDDVEETGDEDGFVLW